MVVQNFSYFKSLGGGGGTYIKMHACVMIDHKPVLCYETGQAAWIHRLKFNILTNQKRDNTRYKEIQIYIHSDPQILQNSRSCHQIVRARWHYGTWNLCPSVCILQSYFLLYLPTVVALTECSILLQASTLVVTPQSSSTVLGLGNQLLILVLEYCFHIWNPHVNLVNR